MSDQVVQKKIKGRKKKGDSKATQEPETVTQMDKKKQGKSKNVKKGQSPPKKKDQKKVKQPLIKEDAESLLEYFKSKNRPFTINFLKDTLCLKASLLQKNIDTLIQKEDIVQKEVGSTKVFLVNQALMPVVNEQELKELSNQLEEKVEDFKLISQTNNKMSEQIRGLTKYATYQELLDQQFQLQTQIEQMRQKIQQYEDEGFQRASVDEAEVIEREFEQMNAMCKKRKNLYREVIGSILSESDLTIQQFESMIGISRE